MPHRLCVLLRRLMSNNKRLVYDDHRKLRVTVQFTTSRRRGHIVAASLQDAQLHFNIVHECAGEQIYGLEELCIAERRAVKN